MERWCRPSATQADPDLGLVSTSDIEELPLFTSKGMGLRTDAVEEGWMATHPTPSLLGLANNAVSPSAVFLTLPTYAAPNTFVPLPAPPPWSGSTNATVVVVVAVLERSPS